MTEAFTASVDETKSKICSICESNKNLSEFYRQGDRFESCCRSCKKKKREQKNHPPIVSSGQSKPAKQQNQNSANVERDSVPQFDESIFYPEQVAEKFGLTIDDLSDVVSFIRWQLDQKNKT